MTDDETTKKLITALLAGNEALRDKLEAQDRMLADAMAEFERLKQPEARWFERVMGLLSTGTAPNHVAASFDMPDGRRVEIVFYQPGGKTPGEVAAEQRKRAEAMELVYDHAISVIDNWNRDECDTAWLRILHDIVTKTRREAQQ